MTETYYDLHNHTDRSNDRLLDCINTPETLIERARELGIAGLAITDHETLSAHMVAQDYVEEKGYNDIKLMLGNEIYLCRNGLNKDNFTKDDSYFHFILIARDAEGHKQLRELSTRAFLRSYMANGIRRVPTYYKDLEDIVGANPGHIIASTACIGGYIGKQYLKEFYGEAANVEDSRIIPWCEDLIRIFGKGNFFLELQPSDNAEQIYVNKRLIALGDKLNLKCIITTDSHMLSEEDRPIHKAWLNAKDGEREVDSFYASAYLMGPEEIHKFMDKHLGAAKVSECIANTCLIADKVENYSLHQPFRLPYLPSEEDKVLGKDHVIKAPKTANLGPIWTTMMESDEDANRVMIHRIVAKCNSNPSYFWTGERIKRMETELQVSWDASVKQGMCWAKYFLQVADYIDIIWKDGDSLVAPGRGSGVGFYLNYLLDIIQIDPLAEKIPLYYWRFLNPQRSSILDIDTDIQSNRRNKCIEALQARYGQMRVIRVATEKTEGSRSAILTAARGLGIDNDIANNIVSYIPSDRGKQRSLRETYFGDEEKDFAPVAGFKNAIDEYPKLWEIALRIEGLVSGISSHAGGVNIYDRPVTESNSIMRLNSGEIVTCFDLHKSEEAGDVKIDLLATDGLTRVREALNLLVSLGYVEKKETLKETYLNAIGVYKIDRDDQSMWQALARNKVLNAFQFDTPQGVKGLALAHPNNVEELAAINSIMRLMASEKGAEQPLDKYARFKDNPGSWDEEMDIFGLTKAQKELLHGYLDYEYGICASQEDIMSMIQDPQLGGWSLKDADRLRKSIAKKNAKLYEELTNEYYATVEEKHLDKKLCDYFWKVLVNTQRGYSFNLSHCLAYSLIALQEMNIATKYPPVIWYTANLIVDSAGLDDTEEDDDDEKEEVVSIYEEEDSEYYDYEDLPGHSEKVKRAKKTMDYGKTAASIGKFKKWGVTILPPDINDSEFTFKPEPEYNIIRYGLRGITNISADLIKNIINGRPYISFEDFNSRIVTTTPQMLNLIKSGCFDNICGKPREELLHDYVYSKTDIKAKINMQNMATLIAGDLIPPTMAKYRRMFQFNKYLKDFKDGDYYVLDDDMIDFVAANFSSDLIVEGNKMLQKDWKKAYEKGIKPFKDYLAENQEAVLAAVNNAEFNRNKAKYMSGGISKWEMESLSFYYHEHELDGKMNGLIANFDELPTSPVQIDMVYNPKKKFSYAVYKLDFIAGTVIDKNKHKSTVTLLTPTGVVVVKLFKDQFPIYDKQISVIGDNKKKTVIESSWFTRGTLLMVQGVRRDDNFFPKKYNSSLFPAITKIDGFDELGRPNYVYKRAEV